MKSRFLVLAFLLLPTPGLATASESTDSHALARHPDDYVAIAQRWVEAARADHAPYANASWAADVTRALDAADRYLGAGRVYAVGHEVMEARTVQAFHILWADVSATAGEQSKRTRVTAQSDLWDQDASRAAAEYRRRALEVEDDLSSLHALEALLYSGEWFTEAHGSQALFPVFRRTINTDEFDAGLVLGLATATVGSAWGYRFALDLIEPALAREGVEPLFVREKWLNLSSIARVPAGEFSPPSTRPFDELIATTVDSGEDLVAVSGLFAVFRSQTNVGIQTRYADAATRGLPAETDLGDGLNLTLESVPLKAHRDLGYEGLLVMDNVDHALYARDEGTGTIPDLARAWAAADQPRALLSFLAALSPVRPPPQAETTGTSAARDALAVGALLAGATVLAGGLILLGRRKAR